LDLHYKIDADTDHMASFAAIGRRSSEIRWRIKQESLANAKVSARQHCVYEGP